MVTSSSSSSSSISSISSSSSLPEPISIFLLVSIIISRLFETGLIFIPSRRLSSAIDFRILISSISRLVSSTSLFGVRVNYLPPFVPPSRPRRGEFLQLKWTQIASKVYDSSTPTPKGFSFLKKKLNTAIGSRQGGGINDTPLYHPAPLFLHSSSLFIHPILFFLSFSLFKLISGGSLGKLKIQEKRKKIIPTYSVPLQSPPHAHTTFTLLSLNSYT